MIKKTIISALVFFIAYNLFLGLLHPAVGPGQHQWQKNVILIQDYADNHQGDPVLIVGTSLSARLYNNMLPDGYYNLSLSGGSLLDGLSAIKQSAKKPKYLLIETNNFYTNPSKEITDGVFDPKMVLLRKYLPSFKEEYQPANLLEPLLGKMEGAEKQPSAEISKVFLTQRIKDYQVVPDSETINRNLKLLKDYISEFEAHGIKVILYEIPINCELLKTPKYLIPKEKLMAELPVSKYHWMPMPDCSSYKYSDGSHMEYESAGVFLKWFLLEFGRVKNM